MGGGISGASKKSAVENDKEKEKDRKEMTTTLELEFEPAPIGICIRGRTVHKIFLDTQAHKKGVKPKWKILSVNGESVPDDSLQIKATLKAWMRMKKRIQIIFNTQEEAAKETNVDEIAFDLDLDGGDKDGPGEEM
mmetsp:Transcript_12259/g.17054  ORF Transcript_12259/g.17054 Transcript_12259/m.17054 type:complete len:136 (+) Transcript_12259:67-474(+)|eukprot:CAMPEP_0184480946 /NCGR_PEP_ID=MMETSP0113_2-20130426/2482_1 /TAXON_ID=91329 /ORGANISM="Norrisiella sphaerica, Strain BC52" /LENGTH=135 /DNA_ID=CAMNT_0026859775 /DNA_START=114 /DNA_END=521 /DNA_ORIENTATION=-